MTNSQAADRLTALLAEAGPILLDFDGPVTALIPPPTNRALADLARRTLSRAGVELSDELTATADHLAVLRFAGGQSPELARRVDTVCTTGEIEAARQSKPTPGAHDAMRSLRRSGHPVVIVSNNAIDAIETYLQRHTIDDLVSGVVGRRHGRPDLMKPDLEPIVRALRILNAEPPDCVMIGDSVTDIEVSRRAGMRSIGYAKSPERGKALDEAGADVVVASMTSLIDAVTELMFDSGVSCEDA